MSDVSNKVIRVNGSNADTYPVQHDAYVIDIAAVTGGDVGSYDIVKIPAGRAVCGGKLIVIDEVVGGTTVEVKVTPDNGSAVNVGGGNTSNMGSGYVEGMEVSGVVSNPEGESVVSIVITGSAVTAGKVLIDIETFPVKEYTTAG